MKWYLELIIWVTSYTLVFGFATPLLIQNNTQSALLQLLFIITISITILKVVKITVSIKKALDEIKPKDK